MDIKKNDENRVKSYEKMFKENVSFGGKETLAHAYIGAISGLLDLEQCLTDEQKIQRMKCLREAFKNVRGF